MFFVLSCSCSPVPISYNIEIDGRISNALRYGKELSLSMDHDHGISLYGSISRKSNLLWYTFKIVAAR